MIVAQRTYLGSLHQARHAHDTMSVTLILADHAHMCRAFRAETGLTPSEYRVLLTG